MSGTGNNSDYVTLVITVTLPRSATTTLRNIGTEASDYIAAQAALAGFTADVTCIVGPPDKASYQS